MELQAANRWQAIDELIGNLVAEGKIKAEHCEPNLGNHFGDQVCRCVRQTDSVTNSSTKIHAS